jgi:outer membrane protein
MQGIAIMRIKSLLLTAATAGLLGFAFAAPASAAAGDWMIRIRGLGVLPEASGTVKVAGVPLPGKLSATDSVVPEIDFTYFITENWAAELIAATTQHSVHQTTAGDIGSVWLLPPTLTAQYHFNPGGQFQPYLGAGINYTFFYSTRSPLPDIHYKNNVGFALQGGVDVAIGNGYYLNADVKKIFLSTDVKAAGGLVRANGVDINPWIVGLGVGYRF